MIRDVVVGGFEVDGLEVLGFDDREVTGVDDGGRMVGTAEVGWVEDGWVVGAVDVGAEVDSLTESEVRELAGGRADEEGAELEVVTTEAVAVTGTSPLLVGSAAGSEEQPANTSAIPTIAPTARLLCCVMNLPDPPAEQPLTTPCLTSKITRRAQNLPELSTRSTRPTCGDAERPPDRVTG